MAKLTGSSTKHLVRPGTGRSDDGVEGDLRRRQFGQGRCGGLGPCERSGLGLLEGVGDGGAVGHGGMARGRRWARLLRWSGCGGVGHGGEKARERRWGRMTVSRGSGRVEGGRPGHPRRGRQAAGAVASSRSPASPLCLLWREEAADWRGPAQCWAGQWAARWAASGKWPGSFLSLCFLF